MCCDEQKDEIAYQAIIYDIDSNELMNYIQTWVDSQPEIKGWNVPLTVSKVWQYGLSDDAFLNSEAECEAQRSSESSLSDTSSSDVSTSTFILAIILAVALVLFLQFC